MKTATQNKTLNPTSNPRVSIDAHLARGAVATGMPEMLRIVIQPVDLPPSLNTSGWPEVPGLVRGGISAAVASSAPKTGHPPATDAQTAPAGLSARISDSVPEAASAIADAPERISMLPPGAGRCALACSSSRVRGCWSAYSFFRAARP
jgi:hypothetical protein